MVIKRAEWPTPPRTAGAVLEALAELGPLEAEVIDRLDAGQTADKPPEDPWRDG